MKAPLSPDRLAAIRRTHRHFPPDADVVVLLAEVDRLQAESARLRADRQALGQAVQTAHFRLGNDLVEIRRYTGLTKVVASLRDVQGLCARAIEECGRRAKAAGGAA